MTAFRTVRRSSLAVVLAVHCLFAVPQVWADEPPATAPDNAVTFEKQIAPILATRCAKCHGEGKLEAGLDVRRKFLLDKGGDSGPAIVAGKPEESLLWQKLDKGEMPPKEEGPLDARHKDMIRRWIVAGAPLAGEKEQPLPQEEIASRVTDDDRKFWSFQPAVRPALPLVNNADRARTEVDALLLARLEEKGISFAADASPETMLRRATFSITGLPPTLADRDDFLADRSPDAYERLVDRLLASPRFGEHAARQWLDVAGYADSDGYLAADRLRPQAWRYRDYVIWALNADVPYDQFLLEQLAGDELSDWRRAEELTPTMQRQLAATGFLRTASDPTYPGYTEPNEIHQVMADTVQIVSTSLLGLTMQCCRCHAHKYDPVPQRDYYALQAIFRPALDPARWQPSEVRGIPLATEAEETRINEHNQKVDKRIGELNAELADLTARYRKKRVMEVLGDKASDVALVEKLTAALAAAADKRTDEQKSLVAQHAPQLSLAEKDLAAWSREYGEQSAKIQAAVASETALKQQIVLVRGLADHDDKPAPCNLLIRGDYDKPGTVVEPMIPEVLAGRDYKFAPQAGYKTTGRRTALAKWIIDAKNPLASRVHVNRVWAKLFGRGIVPTPANFGRSGARPTHPELLDWLAVEFAERGWSQKTLYRRLLTSTAWRQSSEASPPTVAADPDDVLLGRWRAQRLTGEMLRDSTLMVAGKLNGPMFGPPSVVAAQGDGSVLTADDAAGNRRSVYLQVRRSQHVTMLDLFDVPMMEINCPERPSSIVPLQALALLHGPFAEQSAGALAERILREAPTAEEVRTEFAWRLVYSRAARPTERQALENFLAAIVKERLGDGAATAASGPRQEAEKAAWTQAALVLLNSNEFLFIH
ncbi:MAG TPA: PSD1 and planctomycete cytochrome C domain-containing protein [Pirellulaceae bacterium]|nr:PSD1 and planctomycete cytochrome C domain-containing protein [Pirellulaceae bacterium]